jgi:phosphatidylglycerophosphate synthase
MQRPMMHFLVAASANRTPFEVIAMLDRLVVPLQERVLYRPAAHLARLGFTADMVTGIGFGIGLIAVPLIAFHLYWAALACVGLNRLFDGLDGVIARQNGPTDRGAFLDIALDFFIYGAIPFGFALADAPNNALPAAALLFSFIGTGSSFLAIAVIAQKNGITSQAFPKKGIFYLGGLTEGTETIVFFAAVLIWPGAFPLLSWIFASAALITTLSRWWWGWQLFSGLTDHPQASAKRMRPLEWVK